MKVLFLNSFKKDLKKIKSASLKLKIKTVIINLENATDLDEIVNIKKLSGSNYAYRVRIGDYRMGFYFENRTVLIARFLKRSDIYKVFPKS